MNEENKNELNNSETTTPKKSEVALQEEKILEFWKEADIFERSQNKKDSDEQFVFYDGPPFATGLPHYGHILAGTIKDVLPRYQTMLGKKVNRRWGWDCHGLPIENLIEGELNLKTKQDIHEFGVEKFNLAAKESVLRYDVDWKKIVPRTGRWVDMELSYKTMDTSYSESIWHVFKTIYDKNLIYEGHKAMHLCPRCETTLSNFEVNQGYKDIKDLSATVKFRLESAYSDIIMKEVGDEVERKECHEILKKELYGEEFSSDIFDKKNKEVKKSWTNVFLSNGSVVGCCQIWEFEVGKFALLNFVFKKEIQKQGFGTKALEIVGDFIASKGGDTIYTNAESSVKIGFYEKNGFTENDWSDPFRDKNSTPITKKIENTYVLAWTTTPWTLPGNVALAINENIIYSKLKILNDKLKINELYIVAKDRFEDVFKNSEYEIIEEFKGSELVGKKYKPLFDYYSKNEDLENRENGWKIYGADFVTTEDGTGVVHIAPAFGSDDMELGQKENLPFVQHVSMDGKFKPEVGDGLAGLYVKPKDDKETGADHMSTDIEMIKLLASKGSLFSKEKIEHSYPHCWRCKTPLLNYATSSWFLKVTDIKDKLVEVNKQINWVPSNMRDGRFGKWLEGARDWAISRSRFWGAPLPVWKCQTGKTQNTNSKDYQTRDTSDEVNGCGKVFVAGSIDDLKKKTKSTNNIFVMRHGEADNNTLGVVSSNAENSHHLTKKGKEQANSAVSFLRENKIDLIISSPFARTKETAEVVAEGLSIDKSEIIFDERIGEVRLGDFEGRKVDEYHAYFADLEEKFYKNPINGENLNELKTRVGDFLYEIDKKYSDKNILVVTHEYPAWLLLAVSKGLNEKESVDFKIEEDLFDNADVRDLNFAPISHNANYESDVHMPYIDELEVSCECGGKLERIKEVFDCWFESGSMPYASNHYPFENLNKFDPEKGIGFPADFIAEGVDQTRGWFYTSLVLSTALFDQTAFKNVVVNGTILAEDGQKMSKSLKNYPDVSLILNKYGADAMRYYLISSPVVHAEDFAFSEKGVDEVLKKIILKTNNVYSFYELYKTSPSSLRGETEAIQKKVNPEDSSNVLDKWILARLNQLVSEVTKGLDSYELDRASRPIMDFVEDLSTWYIRRSRDRFKASMPIDAQINADNMQISAEEDKNFALETTRFVLEELSKVMAPFMPFLAEQIWQKVQVDTTPNEEFENDSVHLQKWPEEKEVDSEIIEQMKKVREVVSLALEARAKEGLKVRQPLASLKFLISNFEFLNKDELIQIIKDEVNVKDVIFEKAEEERVELDTEITPELQAEGNYRELLRNIQKLRKEHDLVPSDMVDLIVETNDEGRELVEKFSDDLKKVAGIKEIKFEEAPTVEAIKIDDLKFKLLILR